MPKRLPLPSPRKLDKLLDDFDDSYPNGATSGELSEILGRAVKTVRYHAQRLGFMPKEKPVKRFSKEETQRLIEELREKSTNKGDK